MKFVSRKAIDIFRRKPDCGTPKYFNLRNNTSENIRNSIPLTLPQHECVKTHDAILRSQVVLSDQTSEALSRGLSSINRSLERLVKKGDLSDGDATAVLGRIATDTHLKVAPLRNCKWAAFP